MIHLNSVRFTYDEQDASAVEDVSFSVRPGSLVCIGGAECSGKTTLFRLLNGTAPGAFPGLLSGTILVNGIDPSECGHAALGESATSVFDDPDSQIISLTVEEEVSFALVQRGFSYDEIRLRVSDALSRVGLSGFESRQTASLSGGQKQRLVMASAVALRPKILLVDEGTSALDPVGAREFYTIINEMRERDGTTAVVIERDLELMLEFADEILILEKGKITLSGTPTNVCQGPQILQRAGLRLPVWLALCAELRQRSLLEEALPASEEEAVRLLAPLAAIRESA